MSKVCQHKRQVVSSVCCPAGRVVRRLCWHLTHTHTRTHTHRRTPRMFKLQSISINVGTGGKNYDDGSSSSRIADEICAAYVYISFTHVGRAIAQHEFAPLQFFFVFTTVVLLPAWPQLFFFWLIIVLRRSRTNK